MSKEHTTPWVRDAVETLRGLTGGMPVTVDDHPVDGPPPGGVSFSPLDGDRWRATVRIDGVCGCVSPGWALRPGQEVHPWCPPGWGTVAATWRIVDAVDDRGPVDCPVCGTPGDEALGPMGSMSDSPDLGSLLDELIEAATTSRELRRLLWVPVGPLADGLVGLWRATGEVLARFGDPGDRRRWGDWSRDGDRWVLDCLVPLDLARSPRWATGPPWAPLRLIDEPRQGLRVRLRFRDPAGGFSRIGALAARIVAETTADRDPVRDRAVTVGRLAVVLSGLTVDHPALAAARIVAAVEDLAAEPGDPVRLLRVVWALCGRTHQHVPGPVDPGWVGTASPAWDRLVHPFGHTAHGCADRGFLEALTDFYRHFVHLVDGPWIDRDSRGVAHACSHGRVPVVGDPAQIAGPGWRGVHAPPGSWWTLTVDDRLRDLELVVDLAGTPLRWGTRLAGPLPDGVVELVGAALRDGWRVLCGPGTVDAPLADPGPVGDRGPSAGGLRDIANRYARPPWWEGDRHPLDEYELWGAAPFSADPGPPVVPLGSVSVWPPVVPGTSWGTGADPLPVDPDGTWWPHVRTLIGALRATVATRFDETVRAGGLSRWIPAVITSTTGAWAADATRGPGG